MTSFTANVPSLALIAPSISTIASLIASILCADGSLVIRTQDCLNGLSGSKPSLLAFRTSPVPIVSQATAAAAASVGPGNSMHSSMLANVVSALSNVHCLTGDLLSTVIVDFTSMIEAVNTLTGNVQPTGGALTMTGPNSATAAAGNILPSITGGALAEAGSGGSAAGGFAQTIPGDENTVAGNEVAAAGNILGHLESTVNDTLTLLPIITTVLDGKPTAVSVVDMVVNGQPTVVPVVNDPAELLAGLNGGGVVKGRGCSTVSEVFL